MPAPYLDVYPGVATNDLDLVCEVGPAEFGGAVKPSAQADPYERMPAVALWIRPADGASPYLYPGQFGIAGGRTFRGARVRPGRYTIYAVSGLLALEWDDPEVRRVLEPYGVTVDLKAGQFSEVELVFVPSSLPLP